MKYYLVLFAVILFHSAHGQQNNNTKKIFFPKSDFADSTKYQRGIAKLSNDVIKLYSNNDKAGYYNDMFRLYFAKKDYPAAISSLDSFANLAVPDKSLQKIPGFHYRVYALTLLATPDKNAGTYDAAYKKTFNELYTTLPDAGKAQVNDVYQKADAEEEKIKFISLVKDHVKAEDSITIGEAVNFIKQWNFWQVYSKTVALAKNQIAAYETYASSKQENTLLGLDEGVILSPMAKTFIINVTVVDVKKQKLLTNAVVGITGNIITSISTKTNTAIPAGATVIDGKGKFLMPGLTDAHIHFFQSGGLYTRPDGLDLRKYVPYEKEMEWNRVNMQDVLKRNIINGITTVIDVGATNNFLQLRDKFKGKSFAPSVYMTGPLLTTDEPPSFKNLGDNEPFSLVTNEEEGRKMVQKQLPYHPDFIKIWYILEAGKDKEQSARKYLPIIKAIIDESHKHNLKVAVHATESITAQLAAENGCDYLVHSVDDEIISDAFVKILKEKNVILCPTLTVFGYSAKTYGQQLDYSAYELKNANPQQLGSLYDLKHLPEQPLINTYKNAVRSSRAIYEKQDSICLVNLKKLVDGGVRIVAGTDAGNPGVLHGTSLFEELKAMKKSGMSNWEVLQSATLNPAYFLNNENKTGSIAIGKTADMILLNANPLDDLQNILQISLVINKGNLIKPDTLIKETALALVQRQLNAYNARNLEAFLEPYADDVELYQFPDKLLSKGKEAMRKDYAFFNDVPDLHCEIKQRILQDSIIIDKESVTGVGPKPVEATAIYHIEGGKIKKVYFIQ